MREDIYTKHCKNTFFIWRTQTLPLNDVVDSLSVLTVIIESGSKFMDLKFEKTTYHDYPNIGCNIIIRIIW